MIPVTRKKLTMLRVTLMAISFHILEVSDPEYYSFHFIVPFLYPLTSIFSLFYDWRILYRRWSCVNYFRVEIVAIRILIRFMTLNLLGHDRKNSMETVPEFLRKIS